VSQEPLLGAACWSIHRNQRFRLQHDTAAAKALQCRDLALTCCDRLVNVAPEQHHAAIIHWASGLKHNADVPFPQAALANAAIRVLRDTNIHDSFFS